MFFSKEPKIIDRKRHSFLKNGGPTLQVGELGTGCSSKSQECVSLSSCPALKSLLDSKTREAVDAIKARICNKEKKLVCCDKE